MTQTSSATAEREAPTTLPVYRSILLAVDASDHSNRATEDAAALAALYDAPVTGVHVYAAKLHDVRFRQMEGGLPEQYRQEEELERQRDVHDGLITQGLSIITDSYLDRAEEVCRRQTVHFARRSLEGKNYRELVCEANNGSGYDLLVLGSRGLGAIGDAYLGTVCQRVTRRTAIDTLVIKQPERELADGPIVVATDGSERSYGGLLTALTLAKRWEVPVEVVAAYDPHYHYVAFNRIASVLSDEASQMFRFKEQEKLHEEIIDSGIARIYESHLKMAETVAEKAGIQVKTTLLEGKPHHAIEEYVRTVNASLLVIGKLGVHADDDLDIGGNAELLLQGAPCAVLLSQRTYRPPLDELAEITTSWTEEAERKMERVPTMVRKMARIGILRYAQERGHTVITGKIVDEVTQLMCPVETVKDDEPASEADVSAADSGEPAVAPQTDHTEDTHWSVEALARLARVPAGFMRNAARERIERCASEIGADEITLEVVEQGMAMARQAMEEAMREGHPQAKNDDEHSDANDSTEQPIPWTDDAEQALLRVPEGFMRDMTRTRVEGFARREGKHEVTEAVMEAKYAEWHEGSANQQSELPWEDAARERIERIPAVVRGMVVKEVETCAREMETGTVTVAVLEKVLSAWQARGDFHSQQT